MIELDFSIDQKSEDWILQAETNLRKKNVEKWEIAIYSFIKEWYSQSKSIKINTSGSTGAPKMIEVSREMMEISAQKTIEYFQLKKGNIALLCLSADYIAGKMMIVRAICGKMKLVCVKPSSRPLIELNDRKFDFVAMVPLQVKTMIDEGERFSQINHLLIGGGAISLGLQKKLQQVDCRVYESYGMTETVSHIALRKINGTEKQNAFYPLQGVEIQLNKKKCIVISAKDLLGEKVLVTHDLGEMFDDGSFLINGRLDNIINSGGIKVCPERAEALISSCVDGEFLISSCVDERLGECLVLVSEQKITDEILLNINSILKLACIPSIKKTKVINPLPRTKTQKIDRLRVKQNLLKQN
jgi:O-succinylbenzoic acid--CoA ligase